MCNCFLVSLVSAKDSFSRYAFKSTSQSNFGKRPNNPFGGIQLPWFYSIAIIPLKLVMIVVISFTHGENCGDPTISCTVTSGVGTLPDHVTKRIDAKSGVLNHNNPCNPWNKQTAKSSCCGRKVTSVNCIYIAYQAGNPKLIIKESGCTNRCWK